MKQFISLVAFTILITSAAVAHNGPSGEGDDPEKPAKESQYTFSLSKAYFSLFNLFNVQAEPADTTSRKDKELEAQLMSIIQPPQ